MTDRIVYDCEQGTEEWFRCRMELPTASMFSTVKAKGKDGGESKTRGKYMRQLAGEILTGEPMESYSNAHMERGTEMEAEAVAAYAFETGAEVETVGFIRMGDIAGCSPDRLVEGGMVEIKTKATHLQIELLEADRVPPEHMAQLQGQLWVADREWVDFVSYWPRLPLFLRRVYRDEGEIKRIAEAVDQFNTELAALVQRIRML